MSCGATLVCCCTVQTDCCPGTPLPKRLYAHVTGSNGGLCDGSYPLDWNATLAGWAWFGAVGNCPAHPLPDPPIAVVCQLIGGCLFQLYTQGNLYGSGTLVSCSPLDIIYTVVDMGATPGPVFCCGPDDAHNAANIEITETP